MVRNEGRDGGFLRSDDGDRSPRAFEDDEMAWVLVLRLNDGAVSLAIGELVREVLDADELDLFRKKDPKLLRPDPNEGIRGRPRKEAGRLGLSSLE